MIHKYLKLIITCAVLVIASGIVFLSLHKEKPLEKIHYHGGFVVFKENKEIDFSDFRYMVVKPCTTDKKEGKESEEDDQIEKAHLHDQVGDVVHVEKENSKWSDLFINLKYEIDYKNTQAYLNGKKVTNFKDLIIKPYDSLIVLIGSNDIKKALLKAVSVKHIKEAEKRSENCGS